MFDTLYLRRPLENGSELASWARSQGFETLLPVGDMHVTIAYSKTPLEWPQAHEDKLTVTAIAGRSIKALGDAGAHVMCFESDTLQSRWQALKDIGAVWDWPQFIAHTTLSWQPPSRAIEDMDPYTGPLVFGPEVMRPIDNDWQGKLIEKYLGAISGERLSDAKPGVAQFIKADKKLGLIFGWAIVSTIDGNPYFDVQDDHIPDAAMLKAATLFMLGPRKAKEMHIGEYKGTIVHAFPLTKDIAAAMNVDCPYTGLMIAVKPDNPAVLDKVIDGTYTGFSIGGKRIRETELQDS